MNANLNTEMTRGAASGHHPLFPREQVVPFFLVTALFFLWGIPSNLNDVLIRQFMKAFEITRFQAGLVQSAFYMGYFVLSLPAALFMRRFGYKAGLLIGLGLYGTGTILFWPAAVTQSYGFFLLALFVIASGLAFLETGAGPFIAQLGDPATMERRLNFSQAFNPLGAVLGVLVGTTFIFSGIELSPAQVRSLKASGQYATVLEHETLRVITPYLVLGAIVFFWAILIARTKFPVLAGEGVDASRSNKASWPALLGNKRFVQAVIAEFLYVGAQVGTWSYFIQYIQDYTHQPEKVAGLFLTATLVAFGVGRFSSTYFMKFVPANLLMGWYCIVNVFLVTIGIFLPGWVGLWALLITSFFMSLMFPTIFALGLRDLGPNTKTGGSLLVMAVIGGAVATPIMGLVFEWHRSMAETMIVPLCCYVFIGYFSLVTAREQHPTSQALQ